MANVTDEETARENPGISKDVLEFEDETENKVLLAFIQCLYMVSTEGEAKIKKIFMIVQAVSGWYPL